jgi:hypothetical protein
MTFRLHALIALVVLLFPSLSAGQQADARPASGAANSAAVIVIRAGALIDGKSDTVKHDQLIVVRAIASRPSLTQAARRFHRAQPPLISRELLYFPD